MAPSPDVVGVIRQGRCRMLTDRETVSMSRPNTSVERFEPIVFELEIFSGASQVSHMRIIRAKFSQTNGKLLSSIKMTGFLVNEETGRYEYEQTEKLKEIFLQKSYHYQLLNHSASLNTNTVMYVASSRVCLE